MPTPLYRQLRKLLEEHDCVFVRQGKGDHEVWQSPITGKRFAIDKGGTSRHTANAALKAAGIDRKL